MVKLFGLALIAASLAGAFASDAAAAPLTDNNVLVWGDFSASSSDVEGRLAAGGNVSINNYSVGDKLTGALVGGATLQAGGNINFPSGTVFHGDAVAGGTISGAAATSWISAPYGSFPNTPPPTDFAAEQARLTALSAALAALTPTSATVYQWGGVYLNGSGADVEVFNVNAASLATAWGIVAAGIDPSSTVIVNVLGATASMSGGLDGLSGIADQVLFNFVDATSLTLQYIGVTGSILAPGADIHANSGVIHGQVIGASWTGQMQVNQVYYGGWVPTLVTETDNNSETVASVPAPGGGLVFALGLAALIRRRAARR